MKRKSFDCIRIKRAAQEKIRAAVSGMDRKEEIEFFRTGADEFEGRIKAAKKSPKQSATTDNT